MDKILAILRGNPTLVTTVFSAVIEEAKKDGTLVLDLLEVVQGKKSVGEVVKAHPGASLRVLQVVLASLDETTAGALFAAVL